MRMRMRRLSKSKKRFGWSMEQAMDQAKTQSAPTSLAKADDKEFYAGKARSLPSSPSRSLFPTHPKITSFFLKGGTILKVYKQALENDIS